VDDKITLRGLAFFSCCIIYCYEHVQSAVVCHRGNNTFIHMRLLCSCYIYGRYFLLVFSLNYSPPKCVFCMHATVSLTTLYFSDWKVDLLTYLSMRKAGLNPKFCFTYSLPKEHVFLFLGDCIALLLAVNRPGLNIVTCMNNKTR
jgi:hypothetical protein